MCICFPLSGAGRLPLSSFQLDPALDPCLYLDLHFCLVPGASCHLGELHFHVQCSESGRPLWFCCCSYSHCCKMQLPLRSQLLIPRLSHRSQLLCFGMLLWMLWVTGFQPFLSLNPSLVFVPRLRTLWNWDSTETFLIRNVRRESLLDSTEGQCMQGGTLMISNNTFREMISEKMQIWQNMQNIHNMQNIPIMLF